MRLTLSFLRCCAVSLPLFVLSACVTPPPPDYLREAPPAWMAYQAKLRAIDDWQLRGRLNVRQSDANDTVTINWEQHGSALARNFDLHLSGALGLGAIAVHGDAAGVVVEKAGAEPLHLPDLDALSRVYLNFDFPAANLLYWVRGLPVPDLPTTASWTTTARLATLEQTDQAGHRWTLSFDRYDDTTNPALPARIRLEQGALRLTLLINDWRIPSPAASRP
jgi:outer membrane lipoprotein LolB